MRIPEHVWKAVREEHPPLSHEQRLARAAKAATIRGKAGGQSIQAVEVSGLSYPAGRI